MNVFSIIIYYQQKNLIFIVILFPLIGLLMDSHGYF